MLPEVKVVGTAGIVDDALADVVNPNAEPYFYLIITKLTGYQYFALTKDGMTFRRPVATDNRIRKGSYRFPIPEQPAIQRAIKRYVGEAS